MDMVSRGFGAMAAIAFFEAGYRMVLNGEYFGSVLREASLSVESAVLLRASGLPTDPTVCFGLGLFAIAWTLRPRHSPRRSH